MTADKDDAPTGSETHLGIRVRRSVRQTPIMRLTAQRMLASHSNSAPFTVFGDCPADGLVRAHALLAAQADAPKVTYSHLLIRLVAQALLRHPELNAALVDDTVRFYDEVNIGVAVAIAGGNLVVPVIRGADRLTVREIAACAGALIARARAGAIRPEDMRGGTFTLSNVGMFPAVLAATPLLNLPQTATLAIGAIQFRATIADDKLENRPHLGLSLTVDHRAVNGFQACQFVQTLADLIAVPDAGLDIPA
jgi:pyruvate dehydrogenase E2 component (dihydrolipoamide acetyltransferase)